MINQILHKIKDNLDYAKEKQIVSYVNVYNYIILRSRNKIFEKIDYFTLDGIIMVLYLRIFAKRKFQRQSPDFSSYFTDFFNYLDNNGKNVFFLGSTQKNIEKFVEIIKGKYPNIKIAGYLNGYTNSNEAFEKILATRTEILIIGMGTPKQEEFSIKLINKGYLGSCFTCGAFFSQTALEGLVYYPSIISKLHLRWAYRIYKEPKLYKRYLIDYPKGLFLLSKDLLLSDRF